MKSRKLIIWDLDSTLIDTNKVFETAQRNLMNRLSESMGEFGLSIDCNSEEEMDILRKADYAGIKMRGHTGYDHPYQLPLSLLNLYLERSNKESEYKSAWLSNKGIHIAETSGIEYTKELEIIPKKFNRIEDVLQLAGKNYNLLFTEYFGNKEKQYKKIKENNLENYFDHVIMTDKKDEVSILLAVEYAKVENGIEKGEEFPVIYIDDRSKYLEAAKRVYPKCITVNVLYNNKEIFGEKSNSIDYIIRSVDELENLIKKI